MNDFVKKMLDYNRAFVEHGLYEKYTTTKYPDRKIAILACMDTRMTELLTCARSEEHTSELQSPR